jgi:alkanesulfonate monooxygenase SsuD/methylene tetrahydromethanopterin reductase-like flavin-dependent oxidoreductase (luciferase family)
MLRNALNLPNGGECGDPVFLVELAERAEAAGWDALLLEDYICYQGDPQMPTCDVWTALAAIAVKTSRIRLGTSVTPLPRRRPWKVAREAAAIDQLSEGRFILGVGAGDIGDAFVADASFTHFGERRDLRDRAEMLDEALSIIDGLWSGSPFSFRGRHYVVDEVTFLPTPVQKPRIPIWVGGGYPKRGPTRRALRWDGANLYPVGNGDADLEPHDVRELRLMAGDRPFAIGVGGHQRRDDLDAERAVRRAVAEAGADWWVEWIRPTDRDSMRRTVNQGPVEIE